MAVQPPPPTLPPTPPAPQAAIPPPTQPRSGCGRGCGFGCGGCLLALVLVALLFAGGGYWFFVVQASAAVNAPATLIVFTQPVTVDEHPGIPGQALNPGNTVRTQTGGRAGIQFPDGSYMRMSSDTTVTVTSVQLQKNGNLQSVNLLQKLGRTFVNVQHLVSGATFQVGGHSVSAQVRGTQFEVLVRPNGTNLIKVFEGVITVTGKTTVRLSAVQEIDADADGNLSAPRPIRSDPKDPYPLATQCAQAVSPATTAGTTQTSTGDNIATGQTAEVGYDSPGGSVSVALCYPGSLMTLTVIDPNGGEHTSRQNTRPVQLKLDGPAGHYRVIVRAVDAPGGESFAVSLATNVACEAASIDSGTVVRQTLSNSQITKLLAHSGATGVTIQVAGTSPTSARLIYYSNIGGMPISWTVDFYAATPSLGAVITEVTVRGINVTTQLVSNLTSFGGVSISAIPSGFLVDRVYSCKAADGDTMMVVEGHR
jgi:hypothetical protein